MSENEGAKDATATAAADGKLPPALEVAVIAKVQQLVDREVSRFVKFALWGSLIFGALTVSAVWIKTRAIVTAEVDALIQRTDAVTGVRHHLDDLTNRALVTASLIALRKPEAVPLKKHQTLAVKGPAKEISLSFADWARLKDWLQDETLDDQDFADTVAVLASQEETRARKDAEELLAEMLNPPEHWRYSWMLHHPRKRLAILQNFSRSGLGAAALQVALDDQSSKELRLAAMDYIQSSWYRSAFEALFAVAVAPGDGDLRLKALLTCAWLDPMNREIARAVDAALAGPVADEDVEKAIKLATQIWYAPSPTNEQTAEQVMNEVEQGRLRNAERLLSFAFGHGAYVVVLSGDTLAIFFRSGKSADEAFGTSKEAFSRLLPYWDILAPAAPAGGDLESFERLVPRSCTHHGLQALVARLAGSTSLVVSGSPALDGTQVSEVTLARSREDETRKRATLTAYWTDRSGHQLQGPLTGLHGQGFSFSLPRDFDSDSCISD